MTQGLKAEAEAYSGWIQTLIERSEASQRQEDTLTAWVVSLASGAVVAIGPVLDSFLDFKRLPTWQVLVIFVPLVLSIFTGLLYRFRLAAVINASDRFLLAKLKGLAQVTVAESVTKESFRAIAEDRTEELRSLKDTGDALMERALKLRLLPATFLAVGIAALALVTAFARW